MPPGRRPASIGRRHCAGLLQHPPYFHDGSAPDLPAVVEHYDRQFGLNLTATSEGGLVEYLEVAVSQK